jgi:hypothetical protein
MTGPVSISLDIGRPDHLAPLLCFSGNELSEARARHRHRYRAKFCESRECLLDMDAGSRVRTTLAAVFATNGD